MHLVYRNYLIFLNASTWIIFICIKFVVRNVLPKLFLHYTLFQLFTAVGILAATIISAYTIRILLLLNITVVIKYRLFTNLKQLSPLNIIYVFTILLVEIILNLTQILRQEWLSSLILLFLLDFSLLLLLWKYLNFIWAIINVIFFLNVFWILLHKYFRIILAISLVNTFVWCILISTNFNCARNIFQLNFLLCGVI